MLIYSIHYLVCQFSVSPGDHNETSSIGLSSYHRCPELHRVPESIVESVTEYTQERVHEPFLTESHYSSSPDTPKCTAGSWSNPFREGFLQEMLSRVLAEVGRAFRAVDQHIQGRLSSSPQRGQGHCPPVGILGTWQGLEGHPDDIFWRVFW